MEAALWRERDLRRDTFLNLGRHKMDQPLDKQDKTCELMEDEGHSKAIKTKVNATFDHLFGVFWFEYLHLNFISVRRRYEQWLAGLL